MVALLVFVLVIALLFAVMWRLLVDLGDGWDDALDVWGD